MVVPGGAEVHLEAVEDLHLVEGVVLGAVVVASHPEAAEGGEGEVSAAVDVVNECSTQNSQSHHAHYHLQFAPTEFGDEKKKNSAEYLPASVYLRGPVLITWLVIVIFIYYCSHSILFACMVLRCRTHFGFNFCLNKLCGSNCTITAWALACKNE